MEVSHAMLQPASNARPLRLSRRPHWKTATNSLIASSNLRKEDNGLSTYHHH